MFREGEYWEFEVLLYPEGRLIKAKIDKPSIKVADLMKILEEAFGISTDLYVVAAEGRVLSAEEFVAAGARITLLPLVAGGCGRSAKYLLPESLQQGVS